MGWFFLLVLLVQKHTFTNHLSSQGSVFQIILSWRCPLSLSSLCSFSLPLLLVISIWTLSLFPAGSLMWNSVKYRFVVNVHSVTFVPLYFGCLTVSVSPASASITILKPRHSLLHTPLSSALCLPVFLVSGLIFKSCSKVCSASRFNIRS